MKMITETDLKILFTEEKIQNAIKSLGNRLNNEYKNEELSNAARSALFSSLLSLKMK